MRKLTSLFASLLLMAGAASADEGIWLLNQAPKKRIQEKYQFELSDAFLKRLQVAAVRLNNGGSGSFVSPNGLVFTNHHVAAECVQQLSDATHDYMNNGFYAATQADEKACPNLELNILQEIQDVTAKVNEGISANTPIADANRTRKNAMTALEKQCSDSTGDRCDVVTLYSGGMYNLYRYKKYTDVRLVFAPEVSIAAFGGDPDNFTYPRYCLDFTFLRAYEKGEPAKTPQYLSWSKTGAREGDLTFVIGNPGSTGRLATQAELAFSRDTSYPFVHDRLREAIAVLDRYGKASAENKRTSQELLFSLQNSFKAYTGFLGGLRDPELMSRKRDEEATLRGAVKEKPELQAKYGKTWDEVAAAYKDFAAFYKPYHLLERGPAYGVELFGLARQVLRYGVEKQKPNDQRLREFVDPALPSLEQNMYNEAPIHPSMETVMLGVYLNQLQRQFGADSALMKSILKGRSIEKAAQEIIASTKLADVAERRRLANDPKAAAESTDGMLELVRLLEPEARSLRKRYEDTVEAVITSSAASIAQARFAVFGSDDYPDATFTMRLSYGPVAGYKDANGRNVPWATDFNGLYRRATGKEPFALPKSWLDAKSKVKLDTPYNFVTTNDTHGGNSGSPTVNTRGEVVGILFDGNIESLPNRFVYRDRRERSVHVATQAITEALRSVYNAQRILTELQ